MKVYCEKCRYYSNDFIINKGFSKNESAITYERCKSPKNAYPYDTYLRVVVDSKSPKELNKSNDCPLFEEK